MPIMFFMIYSPLSFTARPSYSFFFTFHCLANPSTMSLIFSLFYASWSITKSSLQSLLFILRGLSLLSTCWLHSPLIVCHARSISCLALLRPLAMAIAFLDVSHLVLLPLFAAHIFSFAHDLCHLLLFPFILYYYLCMSYCFVFLRFVYVSH